MADTTASMTKSRREAWVTCRPGSLACASGGVWLLHSVTYDVTHLPEMWWAFLVLAANTHTERDTHICVYIYNIYVHILYFRTRYLDIQFVPAEMFSDVKVL